MCEVKCLCCEAWYVEATQRSLKMRMEEHLRDTQILVMGDDKSDTFAKCWATHNHKRNEKNEILLTSKASPDLLNSFMSFKVLKKLNPISCVETVKKYECTLCMQERLKIVEYQRNKKIKCMNSCSEIYGACLHKPHFHEFPETDADDPKGERSKNCENNNNDVNEATGPQ